MTFIKQSLTIATVSWSSFANGSDMIGLVGSFLSILHVWHSFLKLLICSFNCLLLDQFVPAFLIIFDSFSEDGCANEQCSLIAVSLFDFVSTFQTMMWSSKLLQWIFSISCLHGVIGRQYEPLAVVFRGVSFPQKVMMLLAIVNWISHFFSEDFDKGGECYYWWHRF